MMMMMLLTAGRLHRHVIDDDADAADCWETAQTRH